MICLPSLIHLDLFKLNVDGNLVWLKAINKAVNFSRQKTSKIAANNAKFAANSQCRVLTIVFLCTHPQYSVNRLFASTKQSAIVLYITLAYTVNEKTVILIDS